MIRSDRLDAEKAAKAAAQMEGLPLLAPHNGTETSKAAARKVEPHRMTQRHRVLVAISEGKEGRTRGDLVYAADLRENAVNPRCAELLEGEFIEERGVRDGRAVLWLTAKGWALLTELERLARVAA